MPSDNRFEPMRVCGHCAMFIVVFLSACSGSYNDLSSAFGSDKTSTAPPLPAESMVITSLRHRGATSYQGGVKIRATTNSVDVDVGVPFMKSLSIPTAEIAACAMTCYGWSDQHVDLLIPRTGSDLEVPISQAALDWCWTNKKPMISGADKRAWHYSGAGLPPTSHYREQFVSRQVFNEQTKQSCMGY
jgi:hypothetical protein